MKTVDECRDAIAKENGFDSWEDFLLRVIIVLSKPPKAPSPKLIIKNKLMQYEKQAMELYASQKKEIKMPADEQWGEICKAPSNESEIDYCTGVYDGGKLMKEEIIKLNK